MTPDLSYGYCRRREKIRAKVRIINGRKKTKKQKKHACLFVGYREPAADNFDRVHLITIQFSILKRKLLANVL